MSTSGAAPPLYNHESAFDTNELDIIGQYQGAVLVISGVTGCECGDLSASLIEILV